MATTNRARGVGLLVNRILLYQPRYKVGLIGQVLTAENGSVKPHYKKCLQVWGNAKYPSRCGATGLFDALYNEPKPFEL